MLNEATFPLHVVPVFYKLKNSFCLSNVVSTWAVVVTQLVEQSLSIPMVHGSNTVISKILY